MAGDQTRTKTRATRRDLFGYLGALVTGGLIGYVASWKQVLGLRQSGEQVQDTDGDGVINREDYAPWDTDVQARSDLGGGDSAPPSTPSTPASSPTTTPTSTSTLTPTPTPTSTPTPTPTLTPTPTGQFRYTFETGTQGWTFGKRRDERASKGTGSWSEKYGGSLRLHVDGAPSTIQAWKQVGPLPKGTTVTVHYEPKRFAYGAAGLFLHAVVPNEEVLRLDADNDQKSGGHEQDGTLTGEIPRDLPPETELEIKLVIWPGETTVWIRDIIGQ